MVQESNTVIRQMIKETDGDDFEGSRCLEQQLTFNAMAREFADARIDFAEQQMKTLGLIDSDGLFTNLGFLLSDQCPFTIKVGVFQGTDVMVFKHRYEFSGSLFKQMRDIYTYCDHYNQTRSEFHGLKRVDMRDYPESALREGLMNVLIHRDYTVVDSALINVFDDRMEFTNFGTLVEGMEAQDIYVGISKLRNRNLAQIFYRLHLVEAYGTGIPRMVQAYDGTELKPKFTITPHVFKLILPNRNYIREVKSRLREASRPYPNDLFFTSGEQKVLALFVEMPQLRRKDIEDAIGVSQPMAVKLLRQLQDKNAILRRGSGKNTYYEKSNK
jgi:ATP-dependent DNA helicase RecG